MRELPARAILRETPQLQRVKKLVGLYESHPVSIRTNAKSPRNILLGLKRSVVSFFSLTFAAWR